MKLRDYQHEAVDSIVEQLRESGSTLCQLPTGMGKTVVACAVIEKYLQLSKRTLFMAHRRELIRQSATSIKRWTGTDPDIEMAEDTAPVMERFRSKVCVASKDSLSKKRLDKYGPEWFDLIITDESHHATAATYLRVFDYFTGAHHLGITATPDRADGVALGEVYKSVAYEMDIKTAVDLGWLVPIRQSFVRMPGLDLSKVRTHAGDLSGKDLARVLDEGGTLAEMVLRTAELAGDRRTLLFCASVEHARIAAGLLNERAGQDCATVVTGDTDKELRDERFQLYAEGRYQFLASVDVPTEGWDDPALDGKGVQVISVMRPTQSRARYAQMLGRGTRPLPGTVENPPTPEDRRAAIAASAKPRVEVLDFVGNSGNHKLVHAADVLAGKEIPAEVLRRAKILAYKRDDEEEGDVLEEVERAAEQVSEEKRHQLQEAERRAREQARLWRGAQHGQSETVEVDPYDRGARAPRKAPWYHRVRPPSDKQRNLLISKGIATPEQIDGMNMAQAGELIDRWVASVSRPSAKQIAVLHRAGYASDELRSIDKRKAGQLITAVKANGWRKPG